MVPVPHKLTSPKLLLASIRNLLIPLSTILRPKSPINSGGQVSTQ